MIFVFLCLTSFSMLISRSIHVATNGIISLSAFLKISVTLDRERDK